MAVMETKEEDRETEVNKMEMMSRFWLVPSDSLAVINCYVMDELIEGC